MASPFRTFRKYQKTLLVVAGVVLMFVFVLGDPLSQLINRGSAPTGTGRQPNDVAVKWDGGQLTNAEVDQLVIQRRVVNNFIRNVEGVGRMAMVDAGLEPQPLRVEPILGAETPQQGVEQDVVTKRLFADAARKAGMAISDEYITSYLQQLGRGISVETIRQILSGLQVGNRRTSTDFVLDALRDEMLARNVIQSYTYAFYTNLPEQRYQDWLNVNDRVVVEAAAIPAESMLADVPEPTDKELQDFYDEYKDSESIPQFVMGVELPSPNPGFKFPRKIAVQYLLAEFNDYLTKVEDSVTEEEIAKFYEDNKDPLFISAGSVLNETEEATSSATNSETPAESATTEEKATEAQPNDAKAGAESASPATNDESSTDHESPFRLAAFAQDAPAGSEAAPAAEAATPAAETPASAAAPSAAPAATEPVAGEPTTELDTPAEKPKEFQPLDEVRDQIRREIAQIKVSEQLQELMSKLQGELSESYNEYFGAALDALDKGNEVPPPPAKLADLAPLAQANGLTYEKTKPASMLELRDTPIGKSGNPEWGDMRFFQAVFGRDVELYAPMATYDLDANRYLGMKIEDIPGKVPALDEVRETVIRAWKIRKAGELALKRGEELAKQAQETGASLTDTFVDDPAIKVVKTDPFSFLTVGTVARGSQQEQSLRMSQPDDIIAAGPELMEKVFDLKEGEVAAVQNHDHSVVYIVKIAEHQNTPAELQQAFLAEADTWYGLGAMNQGHAQIAVRVLVSQLIESAGVDWIRDPDAQLQEETEAEAEADAAKS